MSDIAEITRQYLQRFPNEADRVAPLAEFVRATSDRDTLFTRHNPAGHITGSAFIVDRARSAMLMVHHRAIGRWLQPGGHVDPGETPLQSATREAIEETGVRAADLELVPADSANPAVPLDLDSHAIAANSRKNEGPHVHHDFRYLFLYSGGGPLVQNELESTGLTWRPLAELTQDGEFAQVAAKIAAALIIDRA